MTVTVDSFRALYPQFASMTDATVQANLDAAYGRLDAVRWGALQDEGVQLFTAHRLALGVQAASSSSGGGAGLISSKSAGPVSIAYNYEVGSVEGAGIYNATIYGREFWQLVNIVGMGGAQV